IRTGRGAEKEDINQEKWTGGKYITWDTFRRYVAWRLSSTLYQQGRNRNVLSKQQQQQQQKDEVPQEEHQIKYV
ncbi:unnamed protein product, partial [Amoebophrya sp. A25]